MDKKDKKLKDMAKNLYNMRFDDESGVENYYLDEFFQKYVGTFFPQILEWFNYIWDNQTKNEESYGDIDFSLTKLIDTPEKKVLFIDDHCSCADITKFIIIYEKSGRREKFHIRRVWDDEASDHKDGNKYVNRPNLKWFEDREYSLEYKEKLHGTAFTNYGDMRDNSYVLSAKITKWEDEDNEWEFDKCMLDTFKYIRFVARELSGAVYEMKEL